MSPHYARGVSLLEAIIAIGVIAVAAAVAISMSRVAEDKGAIVAKGDFVRQVVKNVTEVYGVRGPFPAGVAMPNHVATLTTMPRAPYNPSTGCFALDPLTDFCIQVPDDGQAVSAITGFGSFWDVTLITKAGGSAAQGCVEIAAAVRTYMISARVGPDEPRDPSGQWLHGQFWDEWWRTRCNQPLTATFRMR